jgi:hypothetical protein
VDQAVELLALAVPVAAHREARATPQAVTAPRTQVVAEVGAVLSQAAVVLAVLAAPALSSFA